MSALLMQGVVLIGQSYLAPEPGYRVAEFLSEYTQIGAFDVREDRVYIQDGDTIHLVNANTGEALRKYGEPADYQGANYASFLTIPPDEKTIWVGYTSDGNADDRIYSIDMESGLWTLKAKFPGNYDLIFWKECILVSGLNSATWGDPNGIYLLDTSGMDQHRLIVEVGGNSAGMAIDSSENLYYGTSYSLDPNAIYRWGRADLEAVLESQDAAPLQISDGQKLTDVPAGISDCEIDEGFNLIFTMNLFGSPKVLALFNGSFMGGEGYLLDTLAVAAGEWDWLGSVKSMGDFTSPTIGERLLTFSFGQPLADLHTANYPPYVKNPQPDITILSDGRDTVIDLSALFSDPDDGDEAVAISILSNSNEELLEASITGKELTLRGRYMLLKSVQEEAEIVLEGASGGLKAKDSFVVTIEWPGGVEGQSGLEVGVYPNPTHGSIAINTPTPGLLDVSILSITGSTVYHNTNFESGQAIDLSRLSSGPYVLRVKGGKGLFNTIIQKL